VKFWFVLTGLILLSLSSFSQDETLLVQKVREKLNKVNDYSAAARLKIDVSFINAPVSNVKVFYKKPNRFKVKKEGGISILPKGGVSLNISSLLLDANYKAVGAGQKVVNGINAKQVMVIPLDEKSEVALMTLSIDETNLLILKSAVTTREAGSYEIDLTYGKYSGWGLPDKVIFSFNTSEYKLPKGITIEYEKGGKKPEPKKDQKGSIQLTYSSYTINKGVSDSEFTSKD
jgi:outer membrane lipoprotein-sorting protein